MKPERSAEVTVQGLLSHSKDLRFHSKYDKLLKVLSRVMTRSGLLLKIFSQLYRVLIIDTEPLSSLAPKT